MSLYPTLSQLYKDGSYGGQCFTFLHKLITFPPVGNTLPAKKKALQNFGIPIDKLDTIKVGDIILTKEDSYFGHGALVNYINGASLQLTESNYNYDLRVHHKRLLPAHSPMILGVFRGAYLFPLPQAQYPIQLSVKILMNNQPFWNSLLQHMANLQNWFWNASGQRIQLVIDYENTSLTGWPLVVTGDGMGGPMVSIIKEDWYNQNVLPQSPKSNFVIFNMPRKDWNGTVFDHPELMELGYAYSKMGMGLPGKIFTVCDEHDDYPIYYPDIGAYAKVAAHEIIHCLYQLCGKNSLPYGTDLTHSHFYGQNGHPMKPEDCFNDFDYNKLATYVQ